MQYRPLAVILALALVAGCRDSTAPAKPASITVVAGNEQTGIAGHELPVSPTFVVNDEQGRPIDGVTVLIAVTAGDGTLASPAKRTNGGPTSVGTWTLGPRTGLNQLTISVGGLQPITVSATSTAGAAAKIIPSTPATIDAHVADVITSPLAARVTDAFDNPIASAAVTVTLVGGGAVSSSSLTSDAQGGVTIDKWVLGTIAGQQSLTLRSGAASFSFVANAAPGDPVQISVVAGDQQRAPAGTAVAPVVVHVTDRFGNAIPRQSATLSVTSGSGTLAATSVTAAADGTMILPAWTLGRTALPQAVHIAAGDLATDISASVQTDFGIDVRFFGPAMSDANRTLFTNAAARISAIVTGDVPDAAVSNVSASEACGITGLPIVNETIDDLVIFAAVSDIDGPGKILAEAGPCLFRSSASGGFATIGVMLFDAADLASMATRGILQDVITHEMLHVVGIGTMWDVKSLITGAGTPSVAYYGALGRQGCVDDGGTALCSTSVPVENNGVPGTSDAHWRESSFQSELMTGYVNSGGMPLSAVTTGSLADMGYSVNPFAADPFIVPGAGPSANLVPGVGEGWEKPLASPGMMLRPDGSARPIRRP